MISRWLFLNLLAALGYVAAGQAGLLLAVPPANASPIWPAAGWALAMVLVYGIRLLPGVFIGAFLVHLTAFFGEGSTDAMVYSLLAGALTSCGSVLQVWAGKHLIETRVTQPLTLRCGKDVARFILYGGLAASTIAPSIGVTSLFLLSELPADSLWVIWLTWWVGDSSGVIIMTPLLLTLFGQPANQWRQRRLTLSFPLVLSLALVVSLYTFATDQIRARTEAVFQGLASAAIDRMRAELSDVEMHLQATGALILAAQQIQQEDYQHFTATFADVASIRNLWWIEAGHQVTEPSLSSNFSTQDCQVLPPPAPVPSTQPEQASLSVAFTSEPCPTLFLYLPVYDDRSRNPTFIGYAVAAVDLDNLIDLTLAKVLPQRAWLKLDLSSADGLAVNLTARTQQQNSYVVASDTSVRYFGSILLGDTRLDVLTGADASYLSSQYGWEVWVLLAGGLAFSALLGIGLLVLTGRNSLTEALVRERTAALADQVTERALAERQLELQNSVLERIARNEPLHDTLAFLCQQFELISRPLTYATVMLFDAKRRSLFPVAAPNLPAPVLQAMQQVPEGEEQTACGRAAHRGEALFYSDIASDLEWENCRKLMLEHQLHAFWSTPFFSRSGKVLGTFALILGSSRQPDPQDERHMRSAEFLCSLAVEQWQAREHINELSQALEQSPSAVVMTDLEGCVEYVNQRFCELTLYSREQIYGLLLDQLLRSDPENGQMQSIWQDARQGQEWRGTVRNYRSDGSAFWSQYHVSPMRDENGRIGHVLINQDDITALRESTAKVVYQATHDLLTGLLNRAEFEVNLERSLDTARRYQQQHVLCFIDLDRFKIINDSNGHAAGDELLRQLGILMRQHIRKSDLLARIGGDEFAILFQHCALEEALNNVDKLRSLISEHPFNWNQRSFSVGMSAGLVAITSTSPNSVELLREADAACYSAKQTGRNRIQVYSPDDQTTMRHTAEIAWVATLRSALQENRFVLFQQRIQYLADPACFSIEILLRLRDAEERIVAPGEFLPAAERYGVAPNIDAWVVRHTLQALTTSPRLLHSLEYCSINLSALSLDEAFAAQIVQWLETYQIPASKLCFEITETAAIGNFTQANEFIQALRKHGIRFALDDFGSGLSSFAYLKNLPVDILKIDGQFVRDILNDPIDLAMVRAINEIGKVMGKQTVAEFVDQPAIIDHLRKLSVDAVQGYAIGRPEPLAVDR